MTGDALCSRCLCGAVEIRVAGSHEGRVGACHCRTCRVWSGGLFLCFRAEPEAVTVRGDVARHASSSFAERAFCPACGTHLWMRDTDRAGATHDLMPGLFEASGNWPLQSEICCDEALASVRLSGNHERVTRADYRDTHPRIEGDAR